MVLDAEYRILSMPQTFDTAIIQCCMRHFQAGIRQALRFHRIVMILRSDLRLLMDLIQHRVVTAVMTEFQLDRIGTAS